MFFERCVETESQTEQSKIKIRIPHYQFNSLQKTILESETQLTSHSLTHHSFMEKQT